MQLDPALTALVVTNVAAPVITWAITRRRNDAAATKDEADAAQSLGITVAGLSEQLNGLYARLAASESRASAAESRLAAAEARAGIAEARSGLADAEVARLRADVAGLRVEVEQHAANEKRLLEQLKAQAVDLT